MSGSIIDKYQHMHFFTFNTVLLISDFRRDLNIVFFFWVFPRRQIVVGWRFGTLYQFHLQRLYTQPLKMEQIQGSETSANYNLTPGKYPKENIQHCISLECWFNS